MDQCQALDFPLSQDYYVNTEDFTVHNEINHGEAQDYIRERQKTGLAARARALSERVFFPEL